MKTAKIPMYGNIAVYESDALSVYILYKIEGYYKTFVQYLHH